MYLKRIGRMVMVVGPNKVGKSLKLAPRFTELDFLVQQPLCCLGFGWRIWSILGADCLAYRPTYSQSYKSASCT